MLDDAQGFRERMACLADQSRFRIVLVLAGAEHCVSELAREVGLSQSCTTRHLQALARLGLVRGSRRGRHVFFTICDAPEIRMVVTASVPSPPESARPLPPIEEPSHTPVIESAGSWNGSDSLDPGRPGHGAQPLRRQADHGSTGSPATGHRERDLEDYLL